MTNSQREPIRPGDKNWLRKVMARHRVNSAQTPGKSEAPGMPIEMEPTGPVLASPGWADIRYSLNETSFENAIKDWEQFNIDNLNNAVVDNSKCKSYQKMRRHGTSVLPFLDKAYNIGRLTDLNIAGSGIPCLLTELVDDFSVPREIQGNFSAMKDYTANWLKENSGNYKTD